MDGALAEVFGDLRAGIVGAKRLLVDVFLEDIAEYVRIYFVIQASGRIVEVPGVGAEQAKQVLEGAIRDANGGTIVALQAVRYEETAVQVADISDQPPDSTGTLFRRQRNPRKTGLAESR